MIRRMQASDRARVLSLLENTNMFTETELQVAQEQIDIYLNIVHQTDYSLVIVETTGSQVAGFLSYGPVPLTQGVYDLYWMAIAPEVQGQGYGKELVRWLEEQVSGASGRMILIQTSSQPRYEGTRAFYRAMGYEEAFCIPDYYKPGDDLISYIKLFEKKDITQYGRMATNLKAES